MNDQPAFRKVLRLAAGVIVVVVMAATVQDLASSSKSTGDVTSPDLTAPSPTAPSQSRDPSAPLLIDLIVSDADVGPSLKVVGMVGGNGLSQPTLDLCNGTYPSEERRTARLQVRAVDRTGDTALSTEAVLYATGADTAQAFAELRRVAENCPTHPVDSPVGLPPVTTRFRPAPDANWPQVPQVERLAFAFDSIDPTSGESTSSVAVYLRRGRALLGVYFSHADAPTAVVQGKTELSDIVNVFAERLAKLPLAAISTTA